MLAMPCILTLPVISLCENAASSKLASLSEYKAHSLERPITVAVSTLENAAEVADGLMVMERTDET